MIIDVLPGDPGYSDFFRVAWVTVPASGFVAGSARSASDVAGWPIELDPGAMDCPVVPIGTHARNAREVSVWYRGTRVTCLRFGEPLILDGAGLIPTSPIYVTFGSAGFRTEGETPQTHNVVFSLPGDLDYSPLWDVHVYDPAHFDQVKDASSAAAAPLVKNGGFVNCPIVDVNR
jgi:hypothetical protein